MKKQEFFIKVSSNVGAFGKVTAEVVQFKKETIEEKLDFYYETLGINTIDILAYNENLDLVVDDEGLFVTGNPVFKIPTNYYVQPLQIAGSFLIGKRLETEENVDTVGFASFEEASKVIRETDSKVNVIGFIK